MSSKVEKIITQYEKAQEKRAKLEEEIAILKNDERALTKEAEEAAEAGNLNLFREKRDAAQLAEDTAFVKGKQLACLSNKLPETEVKSAWKDFNEARAKTAGKAWEAFEKAREDLFAKYMELVQEQNEALKIRERFATAAGVTWEHNGYSNTLDSSLPITLLPDRTDWSKIRRSKLDTPEANYFTSLNLISVEQMEMLNSAVRIHRHYNGK